MICAQCAQCLRCLIFLWDAKRSFCVYVKHALLCDRFYRTHASQTHKQIRPIFNWLQKDVFIFPVFVHIIRLYFCLCIFMSFSLFSFFSVMVFSAVCLCSKDVAHLFFLRAKCHTSARIFLRALFCPSLIPALWTASPKLTVPHSPEVRVKVSRYSVSKNGCCGTSQSISIATVLLFSQKVVHFCSCGNHKNLPQAAAWRSYEQLSKICSHNVHCWCASLEGVPFFLRSLAWLYCK